MIRKIIAKDPSSAGFSFDKSKSYYIPVKINYNSMSKKFMKKTSYMGGCEHTLNVKNINTDDFESFTFHVKNMFVITKDFKVERVGYSSRKYFMGRNRLSPVSLLLAKKNNIFGNIAFMRVEPIGKNENNGDYFLVKNVSGYDGNINCKYFFEVERREELINFLTSGKSKTEKLEFIKQLRNNKDINAKSKKVIIKQIISSNI